MTQPARSHATIAAGLVLGGCDVEHLERRCDRRCRSTRLRDLTRRRRAADDSAVRHPSGGADPRRAPDRPGRRAAASGSPARSSSSWKRAMRLHCSPVSRVGLAARARDGVRDGRGFVAGIDLVRRGGGGPLWQGAYGGATMAGGGLALMIVPQLESASSAGAPPTGPVSRSPVAAPPRARGRSPAGDSATTARRSGVLVTGDCGHSERFRPRRSDCRSSPATGW